MLEMNLAEREGFEPPIRLPVCRISSAVLSTTQPPLHSSESNGFFRFATSVKGCLLSDLLPKLPLPSGQSRYRGPEHRVKPLCGIVLHCIRYMGIQIECDRNA
jgi:hypothetical protein